jgi:serine/threonine-protein kinase RsbW
MPQQRKYQITRAAQLSSLADFRDFIEANCFDHPAMDDQVLYDLKLAADEACTNIITHGYAGMDPGSIVIELEIREDQVEMTITDFGHAFEPSSAPQPSLEAALADQNPGGFGLFFIYQTMDSVDYECGEAGNSLKLTRRLSSRKG